jgi:hypothetical protein
MTTVTNSNVRQLANRFDAFSKELLDFVQGCSDADWAKITPAEGWPVGVTARHIGVGHHPLVGWVQLIVEGQPLPGVTMDDVNQANDQHAREHANCTMAEVTEILEANAAKALDYWNTLSDEDLERQSYLKLFDTDISAGDLFTALLVDIPTGHFDSMKAAVQE